MKKLLVKLPVRLPLKELLVKLPVRLPLKKLLVKLPLRLPRVKPWVAAALLLAVVLLGYYAVLGVRYMNAASEGKSLTSELAGLSARLRQKPADEALVEAERGSQMGRQIRLGTFFSYPKSDDLVAILSATARDTSVHLERVSVGEPEVKVVGDIQYRTQSMSLGLSGEAAALSQFVELVQRKVTAARFSGLALAGIETSPRAQVNVTFYLAHEPVVKK